MAIPTLIPDVEKKIERRGDEWVVLDASGKKVLGRHKTREGALRQLRAIEANKEADTDVKKNPDSEILKLWMSLTKAPDSDKIIGVLTDTSIDRDGEVVSAKFIKRAAREKGVLPMLSDHTNRMEYLLGGWVNKKAVKSKDGKHWALVAEPKFFEASPKAQLIKKMILEASEFGMGIGVSIGARRIKDATSTVLIDGVECLQYDDLELLEGTIVPIQSNRHAIATIAKSFDINGTSQPDTEKAKDGNPSKEWMDKCMKAVKANGGAKDPGALCAWIYRHKKDILIDLFKEEKTMTDENDENQNTPTGGEAAKPTGQPDAGAAKPPEGGNAKPPEGGEAKPPEGETAKPPEGGEAKPPEGKPEADSEAKAAEAELKKKATELEKKAFDKKVNETVAKQIAEREVVRKAMQEGVTKTDKDEKKNLSFIKKLQGEE